MEKHEHSGECLKNCCSLPASEGQHVPDMANAKIRVDEGDNLIIDVPCKNCNLTGGFVVYPEEICW